MNLKLNYIKIIMSLNLLELPVTVYVRKARYKNKTDFFVSLFKSFICFREYLLKYIGYDNYKPHLHDDILWMLINERHVNPKMLKEPISLIDMEHFTKVIFIFLTTIQENSLFKHEFHNLMQLSHFDVHFALKSIDDYNKEVPKKRMFLCWALMILRKQYYILKYLDSNIIHKIVKETYVFKIFDPKKSMDEHYLTLTFKKI